MKKNIKNLAVLSLTFLMFSSCSTDFLETPPTGLNVIENYYRDEAEARNGLVAVYDLMRKNSGGFENIITMFNAASDDQRANGGNSTDGAGIQSFSNYTINSSTMPRSFMKDYYRGIYRANLLLEKLPGVPMDETVKLRFASEARVLRAFYYFNLVRMFKNVPLILSPLSGDQFYATPQAAPEDVWAQIELDINESVANLPMTVVAATDGGRLTQGSARAILGKVYLYQNKNAQAAAEFALVNGTPGGTSQYGYQLLANYNDLWNFSNRFNTESVLEVSHSAQGSSWGTWGNNPDEGNSVNQMVGPRTYQRSSPTAPDLAGGWSFNQFTQEFYDFMAGDPRLGATILDLRALRDGGQADYIDGYLDTGYYLNKFMPKQSDIYSGPGDAVLNFTQNTYAIRLADTYLMEAEALGGTGARAQALLDAVRARVGLPSVAVSLGTIKDERRRELAGEGHRWFDLVRWGDAPSKLGGRGFVAGKNEILPIPLFDLNSTQLVQNPGYPAN